mmetsp:Transcript_11462/g.25137  ORF Transcript_11462/g.25137 Transcript_11462/m.25137 type:complete len:85 (+) Transcript_11462:105-359(+)
MYPNSILSQKLFLRQKKIYEAGVDFTVQSLFLRQRCKQLKKISGQSVYDLAQATIRNVKKASAIGNELLSNGDLPSGNMWGDLY